MMTMILFDCAFCKRKCMYVHEMISDDHLYIGSISYIAYIDIPYISWYDISYKHGKTCFSMCIQLNI